MQQQSPRIEGRRFVTIPVYDAASTIYLQNEPFVTDCIKEAEKISMISETI